MCASVQTLRIQGELAKLGIKASRTTVAKYMDRRAGPPSPTWRTFWRTHAPDLVVSEVYAKLSGRLHAASTRVILALCAELWRLISGWLKRSGCRRVMPLTKSTDSDLAPVTRRRSGVELVRSFEQSPPHSRPSSIDPLCHRYPHIELGRTDVRLMSSVTDNCDISLNTTLTLQDVSNVPRKDGSQ